MYFPTEWRCDATILRDGGKDKYGENLPEVVIPLPDVMVAPSSSKDLADFSEAASGTFTLYGASGLGIKSTDRVVVPSTHQWRGVYQVSGLPGYWGDMGTSVRLTWSRSLTAAEVVKYG